MNYAKWAQIFGWTETQQLSVEESCMETVFMQRNCGEAALLVAALAAEGSSVIRDCSFIRRGYEDIGGDLKKLGGLITEDTGTVFYENIQL